MECRALQVRTEGSSQQVIVPSASVNTQTDQLPIIILLVSMPLKKTIYCNRTVAGWLGFSDEAWECMSPAMRFNLIHPDDQRSVQAFYKNFVLLPECEEHVLGYRLKSKRGEWVNILTSGSVVKRDANNCFAVEVLMTVQKVDVGAICAGRFQEVDETAECTSNMNAAKAPTVLKDKKCQISSLVALTPVEVYTFDKERLITYFNRRPAALWRKESQVGAEDECCESLAGNEHECAMISQTNVGILEADVNGNITFLNRKASSLFGWRKGEGLGINVLNIIIPECRRTFKKNIGKLIAGSRSFEAEKRMTRKDGTSFWANIYVTAIKNAENKVSAIMAVIVDVTKKKQAEEALRSIEGKLKLLLEEKDEFIGIASHELKTPVTSIKAYAEIVQDRMKETGDENGSYLLSKLNAQINRLATLISHLLDTTIIPEDQLRLNPVEIDLNALIAERVEEIKRTTSHAFEIKGTPVPRLLADGERIGQVMTNLLSNAIKYSPQDSTIVVTTNVSSDSVIVAVRDQGCGISSGDTKKIFERFFRVAGNDMHTYPGMGLGLYITNKILEKHSGSISVESERGQGSVFSFTLPRL